MLHRLIIDSPAFKRVVNLQDSFYSIGRHPGNTIVIPSLQISRRHAMLVKRINEQGNAAFHLIDGDLDGNRSRNGLWVNGDSYLECELQHGDVIVLGTDIKAYYQIALALPEDDEENEESPESFQALISAKGASAIAPQIPQLSPQEQWDATVIEDFKFKDYPQETLTKLASIVEYNPYPIIEVDYDGNVTYLNASAREKFDDVMEQQLSHPLLQGILELERDRYGYITSREVKIHNKFFEQHIHYLAESPFIRSYVFDITERKIIEQTLNYQAFYDPLTDLPNRFLLKQELTRLINQDEVGDRFLGVLFLSLKNFQNLNDTFGHIFGDGVLCLVAERLKTHIRQGDLLVRWQGDEFAVLLTTCRNLSEVTAVSQRLLKMLKRPFLVNNNPLYFQGDIGVSLYPEHGDNSETLLMNANAALNDDQDLSHPNLRFYNALITSRQSNRLQLERDLHRALEQDEFLLYYQPQIDVSTGKISGLEALLRWNAPNQGLIAPGQYMNVLEESGLIIPIGEQIIKMACKQQLIWRNLGMTPVRLSINLSAKQFQEPDLLSDLLRIIEETQVDPHWLEFEITETAVMQDVMAARKTLEELQMAGIHLSLDDFGTGYSSLSYLKMFPFNTLKIDRAFIKDVLESSEDKAIVETVLTLGRGFKLKVVAEGVETEEQGRFLFALGCHEMQGYWFSRPIPMEEMTLLLQNGGPSRYCLSSV
ncbi:MAG: EAL domain-containing protein [Microcystaceae cyanobacterium]